MISPFLSEVRPGATGHLLDRNGALALGAGDHGLGTGGDQGRHAVGGGRGVAQIADHGAAALNLLGADEIGGFDDARPGLLQRGILAERGARHRGADLEAGGASS